MCEFARGEEDLGGAWAAVRITSVPILTICYFLQSVQGRLVEDNKSLAVERSHLSDLMSNVQRMHNDLERSGENDRRRLESQMQMLENQTYVLPLSFSVLCLQLDFVMIQTRSQDTVSSRARLCQTLDFTERHRAQGTSSALGPECMQLPM